jgi:hypothetical protein
VWIRLPSCLFVKPVVPAEICRWNAAKGRANAFLEGRKAHLLPMLAVMVQTDRGLVWRLTRWRDPVVQAEVHSPTLTIERRASGGAVSQLGLVNAWQNRLIAQKIPMG